MNNKISSAGLVYFYLYGVLKDDQIALEVVDSYRSLPEGFYEKVCCHLYEKEDVPDVVHIFGVIGDPEKVDKLSAIIKDGFDSNVSNILNGKRIKKSNCQLDDLGNTSIEAYIKHKEWSEDDIYAMLHENLIYHKDGHVEQVDIDFNTDENVTAEVSQILDFGDEAILHKFLHYTADDGIEVMLNMQNVSLIAMPLLKVEDAICSYLEELLED